MENRWIKEISEVIVGKKIKSVSIMTQEDADDIGYDSRPIIIELEDGTLLYPVSDDEGNDGGSIYTTNEELPIIPTF